eukprot:TRINITY_DN1938_c3_g1_i1.p1 TRINITY_DN1938_c3_g1~~TRINITY_DN1938_c3_g1_i1.p1  ORF type:complete len:190 (+),score=27.79 TRINITY_DN1938_c3_g1_i1:36-572(+)
MARSPWQASDAARDQGGEVKVAMLDALIQAPPADRHMGLPPVYFMKIDVEGSEWHVLRGARKVLESTHIVLIEFWPKALKRSGCPSPASFIEAFVAAGFHQAYALSASFKTSRQSVRLSPIKLDVPPLTDRGWALASFKEDDYNILFTKTALDIMEKRQALHPERYVHVSVTPYSADI